MSHNARYRKGHPDGEHRVLDNAVGVGPKAAYRLDTSPQIDETEMRIDVEVLNLDSASFHQLRDKHNGDGAQIREEVLAIVAERGKMQNPVTGSGGMLIGTIAAIGADSRFANQNGFVVGDTIASLVSLTLTPLQITDGLKNWNGLSEQVPTAGHAILFSTTIAAKLPGDLSRLEALSVFDVCGAPTLVQRRVGLNNARTVVVLGAAGKSGSLSLAAARQAGAQYLIGVVRDEAEATELNGTGLTDRVVVADARNTRAVFGAVGESADLTVVCVNVPGCEMPAIKATKDGGEVIFFSMASDFQEAALGAEGAVKDVTMLIGSGYVPGHAGYALDLYRQHSGIQRIFRHHLGS